MGLLKPNTSYVYESPDGGHTIYAREQGADLSTRKIIGISLKKQEKLKEDAENQLWKDIRRESENNVALQNALQQCIMLYYLSKNGHSET